VIQGSLARLLEGVAASLRSGVAPALTDEYAQMQLAAAAEIVENLATRMEWRRDWLRDEIVAVRRALADAVSAVPAGALPLAEGVLAQRLPPETASSSELESACIRCLEALGEVAERAGAEGAPLPSALLEHLEWELRLLRTGMYRRPPGDKRPVG
jgi:hypothetical protein